MKNYLYQIVLCLAALSIGLIHSCTKNSSTPPPHIDSGITTSFTEEFKDVYALTHTTNGGWVLNNFSNWDHGIDDVEWQQGQVGTDKVGNSFGYPAYSYSDSIDEYVFSGSINCDCSYSSWLISPVLSVKNGDKISFYTRTTDGGYVDHMQVLMNKSTSTDVGNSFNSVGSFTTVLLDIPNQAEQGYPTTWTKYEYTFSGIPNKMSTRIAFRHSMGNPSGTGPGRMGIGIDRFSFEVK